MENILRLARVNGYLQMQKMYDLEYEKIIKKEQRNEFISKYEKINNKIKDEEKY